MPYHSNGFSSSSNPTSTSSSPDTVSSPNVVATPTATTPANALRTNNILPPAPDGYHYMPDGSIMSDIEHQKLHKGYLRIIESFNLDTSNIKAGGETRFFSVIGDAGSVFSIEIKNEDGYYYNFSTKAFAAAYSSLKHARITTTRTYTNSIVFPAVGDDDHYDFFIFAEPHYKTGHNMYKEVRLADGSVDINSSTGSDSLLMKKKLYQYTDATLTLSAISPNSVTAWGSVAITTDTITGTRLLGAPKQSFSITVTAASNRSITIDRQPTESDITSSVQRQIGSAVAIPGEDVSSSTYYRWAIHSSSSIHNLFAGMTVIGTNVSASAKLSDYLQTTTVTTETAYEEGDVPESDVSSDAAMTTTTYQTIVDLPAVDPLGYKPTYTDGIISSQQGNLIFSAQQAAALENDTVTFYTFGPDNIKKLNYTDITLSDLKVELTDVTTTTTASTEGGASTTIAVASAAGIAIQLQQTVDGATDSSPLVVLDSVDGLGIGQTLYAVSSGTLSGNPRIVSIDTDNKRIELTSAQTFADGITLTFARSVISGIGIGNTVINPYVVSISSNDITASVAQALESGQTFTFTGSSRIATITGDIKVNSFGNGNTTVYFDLERFLTAI